MIEEAKGTNQLFVDTWFNEVEKKSKETYFSSPEKEIKTLDDSTYSKEKGFTHPRLGEANNGQKVSTMQ